MLKLTVITVVFNAVDRIKDTIESVVRQDYENIEYIIKDGGSTDGTLDIIEDYLTRLHNIKCIIGIDEGIYDAMNIGVSQATGDVIEFLNAGDRFVACNVVSNVMSVMSTNNLDAVYGDVLYENPDGTSNVRMYPQSCATRLYYLTGDVINHQVLFVRRELFKDKLFDTTFRICGDRDWMLRVGLYTPHVRIKALGTVVASYPLDGVSVNNRQLYKEEADLCVRKNLPWGYPIYLLFEFVRMHKGLSNILHKIYMKLYYKSERMRNE